MWPTMKTPTTLLFATALLGVPCLASDASQDRSDPRSRGPLVIDCNVVLGAPIVEISPDGDAQAVGTVADYIVHVPSGRLEHAVLESGSVVETRGLVWNPDAKRFRLGGSQPRAEARPHPATASDKSPKTTRTAGFTAAHHERMLLSALTGRPILGFEYTTDGREKKELGTAGGLFIDVNSSRLAFVATSVGGLLGIGADSKVIPWNATWFACGPREDCSLKTNLTPQRLERAPSYGSGAKQIHNAPYRNQLYSFFGADRPDFERPMDEDGVERMVTLARVLDAEVRGYEKPESIRNLMVSCKGGETPYAVLQDGRLVPMNALSWSVREGAFVLQGRPAPAKPTADQASYVMADSLYGYTIEASDGDFGVLESIYFDMRDNQVAFLTVAAGTTLGFGGEVHVFPWEAVTVEGMGDDRTLRLSATRDELKKAPKLDGEVGADIHNATFRERARRYGKTDN